MKEDMNVIGVVEEDAEYIGLDGNRFAVTTPEGKNQRKISRFL